MSQYSETLLYAGVTFQKSTAYKKTAYNKALFLWGIGGSVPDLHYNLKLKTFIVKNSFIFPENNQSINTTMRIF